MKKLVALIFAIFVLTGTVSAQPLKPVLDDDYRPVDEDQAKLGQSLFYDRVLSGTYRVSCGTCHNHDRASSNGFLLNPAAAVETDERAINGLPLYDIFKPSSRHAPSLFNLGAKEFTTLFSDGRVAATDDGFISPAGDNLPSGLQDVLAVQALFPAITDNELVGAAVEGNDLAIASHRGNRAIWNALTARVADLPDYLPYFQAAFPDVETPSDIKIHHIANALSAFVGSEWRSDRSAFDAYLAGESTALSKVQLQGMKIFYGQGRCGQCHSGRFMTDHKFHATASPLWRFDVDLSKGVGEVLNGRRSVTGQVSDLYRFRTPSLRNVEFTAPYGLAGSHETLKGFLTAHANPFPALNAFILEKLNNEPKHPDLQEMQNRLSENNEIVPTGLNEADIDALVSFLKSLSDREGLNGRLGKPKEVPSSLALD